MEQATATLENVKTDAYNKDKLIFDVALCAGVILMENGAETYRVEDTMERILSLSRHREMDVVALLTGLYVTLTLEDHRYLTAVRRIKDRTFR